MKKVLILEGSPRLNGNSCILSDEFARGAEEAGYTVEKIPAARKKVAGRLGCNACYRNDGICVQKNDMAEIREKMLEADVIVLASPIYFYSMTAQMKAVIDRTYAFFPGWRARPSISSSPAPRRMQYLRRPCRPLSGASPAARRIPLRAA